MINELLRIAEENDILLIETHMKKAVALAIVDDENNCCVGIDSTKFCGAPLEKVILAHELGHCIKGAFYNDYSPFDLRSRHEHRADRWAFEQLVPKEKLDKAVSLGNVEMWQLAEYFDIPQSYMERIVRYHKGLEW